jgi:Dolichyl-phosphate-mannose-protein mannosyltransferase
MTQSTAESTRSRFPASIAALVQAHRRVCVLVLLILIAIAATAQSALKPFWWDELASYDIAQLPTASDVWSFFRAGLDTPSPVPTLVVHAALHAIGTSEVQVRFPFEAGYLLMCLCLYGIVARRYGAAWGLAAMLMPAISGSFYFASELRAYGIILGALGAAIYCWQGIPPGRWARRLGIAGVFAGCTIAIACHIFSIFVLIPFGVAQLVRDRGNRRIDFPVWLALALSPVSLIPEWPGMQTAHRTYAGVFWSKPHSGEILFSYSYAMGIGWTVAVILVLLAWPAIKHRFPALLEESHDNGFDAAEWTLFAALALMPWFVWPLSHLIGVYVPRYVLPLMMGVVLLVVAGSAEALKRSRFAGCAMALAFLLAFAHDKLPEVRSAWHSRGSRSAALARQPWIAALEANPLPIVAPTTPAYSEMQHYLPPQLEQRLTYTLNTPDAISQEEGRDAQLSMRLFTTRLPLHVEEFSDYAREHPSFLLLVKGAVPEGGQIGNLNIRWIANYSDPMLLGFKGYTLYQVDVAAGH